MDKIKHDLENNPDTVVATILAIMSDGDGLTPESLLVVVQDLLRRFGKRADRRPYCPDCGEVMVKTRVEIDDGQWIHGWLCGCRES